MDDDLAAAFHRAVVSDPAFAPADDSAFTIHTRWIETEFDNTIAAYSGSTPDAPDAEERHRITVEVGGKRLEVVLPGGLSLGGGGGGVATALIQLGAAAGYRVWVTSRSEAKAARAVEIGAAAAFGSGERLPDRVDAVLETVGAATWSHSVNSLKPGGTIVISGATSGDAPPKAELTKIFFKQLRVVGSTMGSRADAGHHRQGGRRGGPAGQQR